MKERRWKRFFSTALTLALVLCLMPSVSALADDDSIDIDSIDAAELKPDEETEVNIEAEGDTIYYSFTAPADGTYAVYTTGDYDTYLDIYSESGLWVDYDDDTGVNGNAYVSVTLSEGETIYIAASLFDSEATGCFIIIASEADPNYLGDALYYSYEDGVLTIYAVDFAYAYYDSVFDVFADEVTSIVLSDYIYDVSYYLFDYFPNLETVTLSGENHIYTYSDSYENESYEGEYGLKYADGAIYYYDYYEYYYGDEVYSDSFEELLWADTPVYTSLFGDNRYETVEEIVNETFSYGCYYAVIATGTDYPDALAAASLAGALGAPIILTRDSKVDSTIELLEELGVYEAYIVGGTAAVSQSIENKINAAGIGTTRLAGDNRKETAIKIAEEVQDLDGNWGSDTCIVAYGNDYADALSASPYAYYTDSPIYLASKDGSIDSSVLDAIVAGEYENIIVVGGTSVISESAFSALEETGAAVTRLAGDNRYETSEEVAEWSVEQGMSYDGAAIATGTDYADALAGSALCGYNGSVLLLAKDGKYAAVDLLDETTEHINQIYFLGGTSALSNTVRNYVKSLLD